MADLQTCLEQLRLKNVSTYIQSGNVLFDSTLKNAIRLSSLIENALTHEFGVSCLVVVVSGLQLEQVITQAPPTYGVQPDQYRYDVGFLHPPISASEVLSTIRLRDGVDQAFAANEVLYFQKLKERSTQSYLPRLIGHPAYKSMTIRNWKTTTELHRLMSGAERKST